MYLNIKFLILSFIACWLKTKITHFITLCLSCFCLYIWLKTTPTNIFCFSTSAIYLDFYSHLYCAVMFSSTSSTSLRKSCKRNQCKKNSWFYPKTTSFIDRLLHLSCFLVLICFLRLHKNVMVQMNLWSRHIKHLFVLVLEMRKLRKDQGSCPETCTDNMRLWWNLILGHLSTNLAFSSCKSTLVFSAILFPRYSF